jgi:glucose/arabinose dehydrogenase
MIRWSLPSPIRPILAGLAAVALTAGPVPPVTAAPAPAAVEPAVPTPVAADPSASSVKLSVVASGLSSPVFVTSPDDGTNRLFIVQKTGKVKIVQDGGLLPGTFLTVAGKISGGGERGLLGLAFHPSFKTNRKFYVDYTDTRGNTVIREYKASATNPNIVESGSGRTILRIAQPYANHNGGMLAFGPDGYLYIGTGDGGSAGDPGNRAQSLNSLLGKILRINVNGKSGTKQYKIPASNPYVGRAGLDEIWERGLRNPWRFSFDSLNGNLWIGDVGQNRYEEVDRAIHSSTGTGRAYNWGWRLMEGFHCYRPSSGCTTSGLRRPLLEYPHTGGRCAVTGGYVYRGTAIPALYGWYVYGDYCSGEVFTIRNAARSKPTPVRLFGSGSGRLISSFGEDAAGELYVVDLRGTVYRIDPA